MTEVVNEANALTQRDKTPEQADRFIFDVCSSVILCIGKSSLETKFY